MKLPSHRVCGLHPDHSPLTLTSNLVIAESMGNRSSRASPSQQDESDPLSYVFSEQEIDDMSRNESHSDLTSDEIPTILFIGAAGTGKSSLINAAFGQTRAVTKAGGDPCTQKFDVYEPEETKPIRIIDSRGLERGKSGQQNKVLFDFIHRSNNDTQVRKHIHLVWYLPGDRWEQDDILNVRFLKEELQQAVIVVINKCDTDARKEIDNVTGKSGADGIEEAVKECFPTIPVFKCGNPQLLPNAPLQLPIRCSNQHGNENFVEDKRRKSWTCDYIMPDSTSCGLTGNCLLPAPFGVAELISATKDELPEIYRRAFMNAQKIVLEERRKEAAKIISEKFWQALWVASDREAFIKCEEEMASSLVKIYNIPFAMVDEETFHSINSLLLNKGRGIFSRSVIENWKLSGVGYPVGTTIDSFAHAMVMETVGMSIVMTAEEMIFSNPSAQLESHVFKRRLQTKCTRQDLNDMALQRQQFVRQRGCVDEVLTLKVKKMAIGIEQRLSERELR